MDMDKFPGELKIEVPFTYETKLSGIQDEEDVTTISGITRPSP